MNSYRINASGFVSLKMRSPCEQQNSLENLRKKIKDSENPAL